MISAALAMKSAPVTIMWSLVRKRYLEAERREQEHLEAEKQKRARYESAKVFLEINEDDPYAKWLIGKVSDEFAVEIYLAYEMIQQYAINKEKGSGNDLLAALGNMSGKYENAISSTTLSKKIKIS